MTPIAEIPSPTTEGRGRNVQLPVYRRIETVQEILRGGKGTTPLASAGIEISMFELYDGLALE